MKAGVAPLTITLNDPLRDFMPPVLTIENVGSQWVCILARGHSKVPTEL